VADDDSTKTPKAEALESLLRAVTAVSFQAISITEGGRTPAATAATARDLALAYRYIVGGIQPGSSVVSDS
jgi:hypothetical protein